VTGTSTDLLLRCCGARVRTEEGRSPAPIRHLERRGPPRTVALVPEALPLRVGTLNLASGRDSTGRPLDEDGLRKAVTDLDVDVLAVQEVDAGQPRSGGGDQIAVLGAALGADWRTAATVAGTPDPFRTWQPLAPRLRGPGEPPEGPVYGIGLLSRRPVRRWHVLALGTGLARLPLQAPDPRTGRVRLWWFPDEPRVAVAAEVDGLTVVATHLSFAPGANVVQLLRLARALRDLPGPVVLLGDLNMPGPVPPMVLRDWRSLVRAATFPADEPRIQLDHVLVRDDAARPLPAVRAAGAVATPVSDHRAVVVDLET
jgi:endonuclease/exonuclease/phosphatase family metal-dependent hydrolase